MDSTLPRVSCLMVTADRLHLAKRSIQCFKNQTYAHKELVVVDDGKADMAPLLADLPADQVVYLKLPRDPNNVLGKLRNMSLEAARGDFLLQWDDDDWMHPERIARQVAVMQQGYDACVLHGSIMHLDTPEFFRHPYLGYLKDGWPGSIMHRPDPAARYPEMRKAEDTVYLHYWMNKRFYKFPKEESYLHIRCFHGNNTWEKTHFLTKMRNTPPDAIAYAWHYYVRGNVFGHPRFHLRPRDREAFEMYLRDSFDAGLFPAEYR